MCSRIYFASFATLFLATFLAAGSARAVDPNPRDIVQKSITTMKLKGAEMISTLTIFNAKKQKRERTLAMVVKQYDGGKTEKCSSFPPRRKAPPGT